MHTDLRSYAPSLVLIAGMVLLVTGGGRCVELWRPAPAPMLLGLAGLMICGRVLRSNRL